MGDYPLRHEAVPSAEWLWSDIMMIGILGAVVLIGFGAVCAARCCLLLCHRIDRIEGGK